MFATPNDYLSLGGRATALADAGQVAQVQKGCYVRLCDLGRCFWVRVSGVPPETRCYTGTVLEELPSSEHIITKGWAVYFRADHILQVSRERPGVLR